MNTFSMLDLPCELVRSIIQFMDIKSYRSLFCVSKQYHMLTDINYDDVRYYMTRTLLIRPLSYKYESVNKYK